MQSQTILDKWIRHDPFDPLTHDIDQQEASNQVTLPVLTNERTGLTMHSIIRDEAESPVCHFVFVFVCHYLFTRDCPYMSDGPDGNHEEPEINLRHDSVFLLDKFY